MTKTAVGSTHEAVQVHCIHPLIVEFICTFLFVFAGVGSAMAADKFGAGSSVTGLFFVVTTHTFVVAMVISAGMRISGGHIYPAVTLGLVAGGHMTVAKSSFYLIDQLLAYTLASALLSYLTGGKTTTLASGMGSIQGAIMEIILTFSMFFIVYATIMDPKKCFIDGPGPILTGLFVGANIMAGGPFPGASMKPVRSFGTNLISENWTDHWVYWIGPLIGGGLAGFIYENFFIIRTQAALQKND